MFKGRNSHLEGIPLKGGIGNHHSPLAELKECVAKMNIIIEAIWNAHADVVNKNSPSKQASADKINGAFASNGTSKLHNDNYERNFILAQFVALKSRQEQEIIELLRRIAEIVVQGEKRAAADDNSAYSNELAQLGPENINNSIFEFFCEANVLDIIINIVTGVAFHDEHKNNVLHDGLENLTVNKPSENDEKVDKKKSDLSTKKKSARLLPPIAVATQAIQSISILMQNVIRVTSLYFILSNNRVNDLINFPLKYYSAAEDHQNLNRGNVNRGTRRKSQSAEMAELTTLFISFLKSLAMRMNPETLQFYLTYPMQTKNIVDFSNIQFPLYKRALEFCNPDEDTFVRVTAMNICLNTLRLATNGDPVSKDDLLLIHQNQISQSSNTSRRPDKKISPDGSSLHLTNALPFRERLAISHFVSLPSHVQALTSATFTKIGQLCGMLEEIIRSIDRIDWTLSKDSDLQNFERSEKAEDLQIKRIQLVKQFHDVAADFQDEIYLLEDVFAVGLVPMNEQIIEMMFAGVVYPLVLQPLQMYRNNSTEPNNVNQVADISLAKAAFFVITSIYHHISHKPFLHLLVTALLHPLAPDASKSLIQTTSPMVVSTTDSGHVQIATDEKNDASLGCYSFGGKRDNGDSSLDELPGTRLLSECTYVLSPALAQLYKAESTPYRLRQNSYRRSILACLSGTDGMSVLTPLAIYSIDAMLGTIKPRVLKNVMYGANCRPEWTIVLNSHDIEGKDSNSTSNESGSDRCMVEIIASICRSVMTTSTSSVGLKSLKFNLVASHAICCATLIDKPTRTTALKLIEHRRRESASLMCQIPARLNKKSHQDSIDEDLKMDRIFFDPFCDGDKFAVENTVRKQNGNFWDGPAFIAVAKDGAMDDLCKVICFDPNNSANFETEEGLYRCAANSAIAYLQLDAFTKLLKESFDTKSFQKQKGYLGVAAFALFNKMCLEGKQNTDRVLLSPLPQPFSTFLFDEDMSTAVGSDIPQTGAVVQLVGKTAFPCVVEVSEDSNSLFTDGEGSVFADGIKWQSLWMVLMGKYMILAEPVNSGGNGRVVISYPLCCLTVEKDESADILQSESPARRLLLTHFSPDAKPPGLFVIDVSDRDQLVNTNEVQITRSVMDLWFEDSNAAAKALKALNSKIVKARSRRGHRVREALAQDDRLRFQTLLGS